MEQKNAFKVSAAVDVDLHAVQFEFSPFFPFFFPFFLCLLGIYVCVECEHPLFSSTTKYQHQTPWPAFTSPILSDSLKKVRETEPQESSNCYALKVSCGKCGNGLGHEFVGDGPGGKGSRF